MRRHFAHLRPLTVVSIGALWQQQQESDCKADSDAPPSSQRVTAMVAQHGVKTPVVLDEMASQVYLSRKGSNPQMESQSRAAAATASKLPYRRYIVVGAGAAGRAAADTLWALDPAGCEKNGSSGGGLLMLDQSSSSQPSLSATRVHPSQRRVELSDGSAVRFGALLVASGSGFDRTNLAAGLSDLIEPGAQPLVRPLHAAADRGALLNAAAAGLPVVVMGGSWPAVQLAADAAAAARAANFKPKVTLVCPEAAPLARALPRFLASSVAQKLSARGVNVQPFSLVRYITPASHPGLSTSTAAGTGEERGANENDDMEPKEPTASLSADVFTCRTFDALDTSRIGNVAHVAVSEHLSGLSSHSEDASASLFNLCPEDPLTSDDSSGGLVEWHNSLGGVVVNAELQCCSGVWACGDAAVFPHPVGLGRCRGRGADVAVHTAHVAARNMVAATCGASGGASSSPFQGSNWEDEVATPVAYTRPLSYRGTSPFLGIDFVAVGRCDGEAETHSFWWKDEPTGSSTVAAATIASSSGKASKPAPRSSAFYGPKTPAPSSIASAVEPSSSSDVVAASPTKGDRSGLNGKSGVVFHMDHSGQRVVGVTLWNVPMPQQLSSLASLSGDNAEAALQANKSAERAASLARQLIVEHRGQPHAAAASTSASSPTVGGGLKAEDSSSEELLNAVVSGSSDSAWWKSPASSLERWYALRPAERERLAAFTAKRALVASLKQVATDVAITATCTDNDGASVSGAAASRPKSSKTLKAEGEAEEDSSSKTARIEKWLGGGGNYRYTPAKADRNLFTAAAPSSGVGGRVNDSGSRSGSGGGGGSGSGRDWSEWTSSAAVGGESPFTRGRHGRSAAAGRAEAFAAGLRGDMGTEGGAYAQNIFHPSARG